jgi:hypothetical protein
MANKKNLLGILVMVLVFGMTAVGCDNGTTETKKTYYYEGFEITMAQYNSFMSTTTPGYTYTNSQIKGFRQTLRNFNGRFVESNTGVTEAELRNFFVQAGISPSDYTELKASLDSVGNLIYFFSQNYSSNIIWIYFEKE